MKEEFFQSKSLTRDYHLLFQNRIHTLDIMTLRRSWRKYEQWAMGSSLMERLRAFFKRSAILRGCPEDDIILFTDKERLPFVLKRAGSGLMGRGTPWLSKSGAAGLMAIAVDKKARHEIRPISFAYPTMTAEDTVLWLTENGLGSVWLGAFNGPELAKALELPPNKRIPAITVFGKTGSKPGGVNIDNMLYRTLSRKRKKLEDIAYIDHFGNIYNIPENPAQNFSGNSSADISQCLEMLSKWDNTNSAENLSQMELELLAESGRIAPSSANRQPWKFIIIKNPQLIDEIRNMLGESRPFSGIIAGMGTRKFIIDKGLEVPYWMIDVPLALSHISIMAGALNIASKVYMNIPEEKINSLLRTDSGWTTTGIIGLRK